MKFKQWLKRKKSEPKVINPFICSCECCFPVQKITEEEIAEIKALLKQAEKERLL